MVLVYDPQRAGITSSGYIFETTHLLSYKGNNQSHWLQKWNCSGSWKTFFSCM